MGIGTRSLKRDSNWLQALPAADRHVAVAPRHRRGEGTPPYGSIERNCVVKIQTQEIQSILAGLDFG